MVPVERKANVSGNEFRLRHPYLGFGTGKLLMERAKVLFNRLS